MLAGRRTVPGPSRPRWRREGGLAGGEREPGRVGVQPSPHRGRVRSGQHRHPQRQLIQRRAARGEHQARPRADPGADASPAPRIRGSTPACSSDDLPAPETPDTTSRPAPCSCRDIRSSSSVVAASRPKKNAASCSSNALSPRYGESITPETLTSGGGATPSVQVSLL